MSPVIVFLTGKIHICAQRFSPPDELLVSTSLLPSLSLRLKHHSQMPCHNTKVAGVPAFQNWGRGVCGQVAEREASCFSLYGVPSRRVLNTCPNSVRSEN